MATLSRIFPLTSCRIDGKNNNFKNCMKILQQESARHSVVVGAKGVGKTSLMFQCAISYAIEGANVTFICSQPPLKMPLMVHAMPHPDAVNLQNVKFLYLKTSSELTDFCASIHNTAMLPDVVLVDDISFYIGQTEEHCPEHEVARLLAHLLDALAYIEGKKSSGEKCQLLVGSKEMKFVLPLCKKFGFNIFSLEGPDETTSCYYMKVNAADTCLKFLYSIDHEKGIFLHEVQSLE